MKNKTSVGHWAFNEDRKKWRKTSDENKFQKKTHNYRSVHIFAINEWIKHGNTLKIKNEDRLNKMQEKAAIGRTRTQAQKQN